MLKLTLTFITHGERLKVISNSINILNVDTSIYRLKEIAFISNRNLYIYHSILRSIKVNQEVNKND